MACPDRTEPFRAEDGQSSPKQRRIRRRQGSLGRGTDAAARWLPILGRLREECLGALDAAASARDEPVICRLRGRELISIDCYLIQILGWHWTCTNGCSCWSPDEENRLRFFLTHGCALRTELGASGCSVVRRRDKGRDPDGRPAHWHSSAYSTTVIPIDASSTGQRLPHQVAPAPPHRHAPGPHTVGFGFRPCRRTGAPAREPDGTRPQV